MLGPSATCIEYSVQITHSWSHKLFRPICLMLLSMLTLTSFADINFKEVTQQAGMNHISPTYGASWGDLNSDGWPDLWISNHNQAPHLYLNQQNGKFIEVIKDVWSADPDADAHGAAWADFDNDGDQDLIEMVGSTRQEGGSGWCWGCGETHLFVNDNGILREAAKEYNLVEPLGAGNTPLWFDANHDGKLDLLIVNRPYKGKANSVVYEQIENVFKNRNQEFGFKDEMLTRMDKVGDVIDNALQLRFEKPGYINTYKSGHYAQLADISGDDNADVVVFSQPSTVYKINSVPFKNISTSFAFPELKWAQDSAIEDFNGDGKLDLFITTRHGWSPDVILASPSVIKGSLNGATKKRIYSIEFETEGEVSFDLHPEWLSLDQMFIGSARHKPSIRSFTLSPEDSKAHGSNPPNESHDRGVQIYFDKNTNKWKLHNTNYTADFIIRSKHPIEKLSSHGFNPSKGEHKDKLLINDRKIFTNKKLTGDTSQDTACHSVTAGDFDNDMDVDLYLVCLGPIENLSNRLYMNDGQGNLSLVANAGGAAGSTQGRGDIVVSADYDRDGFLDLFVANGADPASIFSQGPYQLFRNQGNQNHWLEIDLQGTSSNRDGIGATVELETENKIQIRSQGNGMHRFAQNHSRLHFGLGNHTTIKRLTVHWPSGIVQHIHDIKADQIMLIKEAEKTSTD